MADGKRYKGVVVLQWKPPLGACFIMAMLRLEERYTTVYLSGFTDLHDTLDYTGTACEYSKDTEEKERSYKSPEFLSIIYHPPG